MKFLELQKTRITTTEDVVVYETLPPVPGRATHWTERTWWPRPGWWPQSCHKYCLHAARSLGNDQLFADFPVALAFGDELEDFYFPLGQAGGIRSRPG